MSDYILSATYCHYLRQLESLRGLSAPQNSNLPPAAPVLPNWPLYNWDLNAAGPSIPQNSPISYNTECGAIVTEYINNSCSNEIHGGRNSCNIFPTTNGPHGESDERCSEMLAISSDPRPHTEVGYSGQRGIREYDGGSSAQKHSYSNSVSSVNPLAGLLERYGKEQKNLLRGRVNVEASAQSVQQSKRGLSTVSDAYLTQFL